MRMILFLFCCLILTAAPLLVVHADEEPAAEAVFEDGLVAEGKQIFQRSCNQCHELPKKTRRTAKQWDQMIEIMQAIMTQRGAPILNDDEKQQVLAYLKTSALVPPSEDQSDAEDMFIVRCALCHQLPDPGMLKPQQWKLIISTMQQRMQQAGVRQLDDQELETILEYLGERAR
jgi:mono/diheme cytochrome c family protein